MLDARQNENGNAGFCNAHIANPSIFKEKIALFCRFFSLCPHILPYISRRTTARCPRSDLLTYMITAFDLVISAFLVIFVRYTILTWMKVLIVNTSESTGGAAVAAHRLMDALRANGMEAEMLVRNRSTSDTLVHAPHCNGGSMVLPLGTTRHLHSSPLLAQRTFCHRHRQCGHRHHRAP